MKVLERALIFSLTWLRKHDKGHGVMIEGLVNQSLLAIKGFFSGFIPVLLLRDDMQMLVSFCQVIMV